MTTKNSKYSLPDEIMVQKINDNTVIFNPNKSKLYTLNSTAAFIVDKLQKGFSVERISDLVSEEFNTSKPQAFKDTQELIRRFSDEKVLFKDK